MSDRISTHKRLTDKTAPDALATVLGSQPPGSHIPSVLRKLTKALNAADIEYSLCGYLALSHYTPARYTDNISILALPHRRGAIEKIVHNAGFVGVESSEHCDHYRDFRTNVDLYIKVAISGSETFAVEDHDEATILGTKLSITRPEHLLWMYCQTDRVQSTSDAVALVIGNKVDVDRTKKLMNQANDTPAYHQLLKVKYKVAKGSGSTYSSSVAKRLVKRVGG